MRAAGRLSPAAPGPVRTLLRNHFFRVTGIGGRTDTGMEARRLLADGEWSAERYEQTKRHLRERMEVYEGEEGFFPPYSEVSRSFACAAEPRMLCETRA